MLNAAAIFNVCQKSKKHLNTSFCPTICKWNRNSPSFNHLEMELVSPREAFRTINSQTVAPMLEMWIKLYETSFEEPFSHVCFILTLVLLKYNGSNFRSMLYNHVFQMLSVVEFSSCPLASILRLFRLNRLSVLIQPQGNVPKWSPAVISRTIQMLQMGIRVKNVFPVFCY